MSKTKPATALTNPGAANGTFHRYSHTVGHSTATYSKRIAYSLLRQVHDECLKTIREDKDPTIIKSEQTNDL